MADNKAIADHYKHGSLLEAIEAALEKIGKTKETVSIEDLGPVDEFHIGSRLATKRFLDQLKFTENDHVLDIGCGLGGAARFVAKTYGSQVTGVDLVSEYVDTGNELSKWVKLGDKITLSQGSAEGIDFGEATFSGAYMLHVGMNIEDKEALFKEVYKVLKPKTKFGIYDIMQDQAGELVYPAPWAAGEETSFLSTPDEYKKLLENAGFEVTTTTSRRDFALEFFAQVKAKTEANGGPLPLGLHVLMQGTTPEKIRNMLENISSNLIAPVEMIATKP
jgi:ubiquinone/menaquinone biosynthesis C-methylase UbiE